MESPAACFFVSCVVEGCITQQFSQGTRQKAVDQWNTRYRPHVMPGFKPRLVPPPEPLTLPKPIIPDFSGKGPNGVKLVITEVAQGLRTIALEKVDSSSPYQCLVCGMSEGCTCT